MKGKSKFAKLRKLLGFPLHRELVHRELENILENFEDGYYVASYKGNKTVVKKEGEMLLLSTFYDYIYWLDSTNGIAYAEVKKDGKWGILKFDGTTESLSTLYDDIGLLRLTLYDDDNGLLRSTNGIVYARVKKDRKWGILKFDGKNVEISYYR